MSWWNRTILLLTVGLLLLNAFILAGPRLWPAARPTARSDNGISEDPSNPCGPIAAAIIGHWYGKTRPLAEVKSAIRCDALGRTSMAELRSGLSQLGFYCEGIKVSPDMLAMLRLPAILFVNGNHFVVVVPSENQDIIVIDPPRPTARVWLDALPFSWNGHLLLCASTQDQLDEELRQLKIQR